jgi:peroxiredoxin
MFGLDRYNYPHFTRELLAKDMAKAGGPAPGDRAPDFELRSLEGDKFRLRDFRGQRNVVLTFGSLTCPMTAGSIGGMNELYREHQGDDVQCLFVYVREAHPGESAPPHESLEDKIRAAERLRDEEDIDMPLLVDDLKGTVHRKYGGLPNPTYIIDKSGRIAFRALWTRPGVVAQALEELLGREDNRHAIVKGGEERSIPIAYGMLYAHRALDRGGRQAVRDFREAMGVPGQLALLSSRVAEPIAEHPMRVLGAVALGAGVLTAGLMAGKALRQRREMREPYDAHGFAGWEDDEAVGI